MKLNLETKNKEQELIKTYLEENVSETLAEKINNGTPFEKDGKMLINRKTLDGFMKYATDEARKLASKGANSACIEGEIVCGWAIHYFEEESVEGILFNEDGTKYKPVKTTTKTSAPPVKTVIQAKPEPKPQMSLFDFMTTTENEPEELLENTANDEPPTEEELQEAFEEMEQEKHWINENTYVDNDGIMHEIEKTPLSSAFDADTLTTLQEILGDELELR